MHRLRVRWAEVDMQQIVFNGHYLMYVDTAMAGYWRALALPYQATMLGLGGDLYVRKATLDYEASAHYDDACDIGLRCVHIGRSSLRFQAAVFRGEQRLVHGELIYVYANPATQTAQPVPDALRAVVLGFETGQPMLNMQVDNWQALGAGIQGLRDATAAAEGATAPVGDDTAWHACARNRLGVVVGCARWQPAADGAWWLDDMRVLHAVRGGGVGRSLLQQALVHARLQGVSAMLLHAPSSAAGFFACAGFKPVGDAPAAARATGSWVSMRLALD